MQIFGNVCEMREEKKKRLGTRGSIISPCSVFEIHRSR